MYRDLDALRAAHLPLNSEAGPGGGYAIDSAYQLPPVNFTVREATLLVWAAEWIQRQRILPFYDTLNDAAAKVRAALPLAQQIAVERRAADVSFVGVPGLAVPEGVRRAIEAAWVADAPCASSTSPRMAGDLPGQFGFAASSWIAARPG
ncbi:MAG: putative DNA-binding transcriptional regulator YafY [Bradymonadia bacterium]|jgi:predicted DNA-binding transcriptional regulator YafY